MEVRFRTAELREAYTTQKKGVKLWGPAVARKYVQRIDALYAARSADDLFKIPPLRFHPLGGDRDGKYALTVHDRVRLTLSFEDEALTKVLVEGVSKHYGN